MTETDPLIVSFWSGSQFPPKKLQENPMTTAEKTAALTAALAEHQDNLAAVQAANLPQSLQAVVSAALTKALSDKLAVVFK